MKTPSERPATPFIVGQIRHSYSTLINHDDSRELVAYIDALESSLLSAESKAKEAQDKEGEFIEEFERVADMSMSQVDWDVAALTILRVIKQRLESAERSNRELQGGAVYIVAGWLRDGHQFIGLPEHVRPMDEPVYTRRTKDAARQSDHGK